MNLSEFSTFFPLYLSVVRDNIFSCSHFDLYFHLFSKDFLARHAINQSVSFSTLHSLGATRSRDFMPTSLSTVRRA